MQISLPMLDAAEDDALKDKLKLLWSYLYLIAVTRRLREFKASFF
jgi:hypothetical protein